MFRNLNNLENNMLIMNNKKKLLNIILNIDDQKISYFSLCKKKIVFINKNNIKLLLNFSISKILFEISYILNIYYLNSFFECNNVDCLNNNCDGSIHYLDTNLKILIKLKDYNVDRLIENFPIIIQDIYKCIYCNNIYYLDEKNLSIEKNNKFYINKCIDCTFKSFIDNKSFTIINNCSICFNNIYDKDKYIITKCNHYFHKTCLNDWTKLKNNCPLCRTDIVNNNKKYSNDLNIII